MEFDTEVKLSIYTYFAETGMRPTTKEIASRVGAERSRVVDAYQRLGAQRLLVLEADVESIRMAPPFSGVPTQHIVEADGVQYYANCAWDALGIPAALQKAGTVRSRCEQSGEPLLLPVGIEGPQESKWLFHCRVPAARWWQDIVFT